MSSTTEQIKERLSIVEVVSSYVKLERAGQNWKARCPFHNERTPSFIVSPSRNSYHCFGCNRGGDIFSFVEEIEGVEFKEALRSLAERAGVQLPRQDPKERGREARAYALLEEAARFFEAGLSRSEEAREYLKKRGLADATVEGWRLGYVPDEWRLLLTHLKNKGYVEQEIEAAGLAIKSDKGETRYYDRFRGRIVFPIENAQGKIAGFSGRAFPSEGQSGAKYINSPETALFNKSRILYGLSRAKQAMMREDFAVLVEGQMDLLMAHQAGISNAVATSGTALTEEHLKMVRRFTPNLVLAFDSDEAGFAASERGFKMAALSLPLGMNVRVTKLPKGEDPADFAARDPEGFGKAVKDARYIVDFYLETLRERGLDERTMVAKVRESVLPLIALIPSHMDRAHYVGAVARAVSLDEAHVWEELKKGGARFEIKKEEDTPARPSTTRGEKLAERIAGVLEWLAAGDKKEATERWRERYKALRKESSPLSREKRESLILEAEVYYSGSEHLERDIGELFLLLEQATLEENLEAAMKSLRAAEKGRREKEAEEALARFHEVSKRLNEVKQELKLL